MALDKHRGVAATPYARLLARQKGIDLAWIKGSGPRGEIRGRDLLSPGLDKLRLTPLARRIALSEGLDLTGLVGSGFRGKLFVRDLDPAKKHEGQALEGHTTEQYAFDNNDQVQMVEISSMRRVIAKRMFESHSEIPAVSQHVEVDVTRLFECRKALNEGPSLPSKISINDLVIKAVAHAVAEQERFRMQYRGDLLLLHSACHIGMAVGMEDGLQVPVIRAADQKSLLEIAEESKKLADKARNNRLMPEDIGGAVMTVSNMGMYGTYTFTPIINQPEASILGVNAVHERLVMAEDGICQRKKMMLSLTFDHRIINGTEAALFENRVKELLESPELIDPLIKRHSNRGARDGD